MNSVKEYNQKHRIGNATLFVNHGIFMDVEPKAQMLTVFFNPYNTCNQVLGKYILSEVLLSKDSTDNIHVNRLVVFDGYKNGSSKRYSFDSYDSLCGFQFEHEFILYVKNMIECFQETLYKLPSSKRYEGTKGYIKDNSIIFEFAA